MKNILDKSSFLANQNIIRLTKPRVRKVVFKHQFLFILFSIITTFTCCTKAKPTIFKMEDKAPIQYENQWLSDAQNFENSAYKDSFNLYFYNALKHQDFNKASKALLSVCDIMNSRGYYDPYYIEILAKYLKENNEKIFKDHLFSMYVTLGVSKTFSGSFEESTKTLEELAKLKPDNYSTMYDLGFAYYYISCNYYYLGDYLKSLEELNKGISCMNQTDDIGGQLFLEQRKSFVQYTTKNYEDALNTIEKCLKLYKKINDKEGETLAMLSKHDYISRMDRAKAHIYLDSIGPFIEKNKISNLGTIVQHQYLLIKRSFENNDVEQLDNLIPAFAQNVRILNTDFWNKLLLSAESRFEVIQKKELSKKSELLSLLDQYKKNEDYLNIRDLLLILKDEAANKNNIQEFKKYDDDLEYLEEKIQKEELQFKVKTFEQRIDVSNKEKVIAQQGRDLAKSKANVAILFGVLFVILLLVWIFSLRRRSKQAAKEQYLQEQFTQQLLQNTEEERSRIANELHDGVNHQLLTIKNSIATDKKVQAEEIGEVIEEVRNISRNLHPSILQTAGFEVAVNNLCDRITEAGLFTTCDIEYVYKLSKNKELQLYRIIQEALNNTLKHGKANAAKVILTSQDNFLHLEIKDNGSGFDVDEQINNSKSFGLQSILQRAKAIMAKVNIQSTTKGTVILIKIPVQ